MLLRIVSIVTDPLTDAPRRVQPKNLKEGQIYGSTHDEAFPKTPKLQQFTTGNLRSIVFADDQNTSPCIKLGVGSKTRSHPRLQRLESTSVLQEPRHQTTDEILIAEGWIHFVPDHTTRPIHHDQ